jgi:hypothetical protein
VTALKKVYVLKVMDEGTGELFTVIKEMTASEVAELVSRGASITDEAAKAMAEDGGSA